MKSSVDNNPTPLSKAACYEKLHSIGQEHLLNYWPSLRPDQKAQLQNEVAGLNVALLRNLQAFIEQPLVKVIEPLNSYSYQGDTNRQKRGQQLVQEGKVALVILAGGQGSRLRYEGPKGCYPVSLIKHKSLFQLLAEKVKAASILAKRELEMAIMTSPSNKDLVEIFFASHAFFGLAPHQVHFFCQQMWPLLDLKGNLFLETPSQIAKGPNGNGGLFESLVVAKVWEKWKNDGIELVNVIPIDNPLADPFDFELFGFHIQEGCDVAIKAIKRDDPYEPVGALAYVDGKVGVVEYMEMCATDKKRVDAHGNLKFNLANLSLFSFSLPFISHVATQALPLHRAKKAVKVLDLEGQCSHVPDRPNAWKFEEFIFDALLFARHAQILLYPRALTFAPLKNLEGESSIRSVQHALLAFDRHIFTQVTGVALTHETRFELAPQFYYPTDAWLKKWQGHPLPKEEYIDE
jgi:UDP-N-acetylglucosamine/UDP-N-acetylgalactosamine diphosphorylase